MKAEGRHKQKEAEGDRRRQKKVDEAFEDRRRQKKTESGRRM